MIEKNSKKRPKWMLSLLAEDTGKKEATEEAEGHDKVLN